MSWDLNPFSLAPDPIPSYFVMLPTHYRRKESKVYGCEEGAQTISPGKIHGLSSLWEVTGPMSCETGLRNAATHFSLTGDIQRGTHHFSLFFYYLYLLKVEFDIAKKSK